PRSVLRFPSVRSTGPHRRRPWWVGLAGAPLVLLALSAASSSRGPAKKGPPPAPPVSVVAAEASRGDLGVYVSGLGAVTPLSTVAVRSRVDGQLMSVAFEEGQLVKQGQLLAQVDPRPFQAQLELAQGQLARDQASLENAQLDLKRYSTLQKQ